VIATATDTETLKSFMPANDRMVLMPTASGVRIQVPDEAEVDSVIAALRRAGGKLVSVQPLRQSLEELFLDNQ